MKPIMIFSFTNQGAQLNKQVHKKLTELSYVCDSYTAKSTCSCSGIPAFPQPISEMVGTQWGRVSFIFIGATGIAVRYIAPYVKDKYTDSAVLSMDENGAFVIPVVSGHIGGGVALAETLAQAIGAVPVITTATDIQSKFAVDIFAKNNKLQITNRHIAKEISVSILNNKKVGLYYDIPFICEQLEHFRNDVEIVNTSEELQDYTYGIWITSQQKEAAGKKHILYLIPEEEPEIIVGIGCRKGITKEQIESALVQVLMTHQLALKDIKALASIDRKREEQGIVELAKDLQVPFVTYSTEELQKVESVSVTSTFVEQTVGVDNVCERAARVASGQGMLIQPKTCIGPVTISLARADRVETRNTVLVFAGTTEGRELIGYLQQFKIKIYAYVATDYGAACIPDYSNVEVLHGRLNQQEMECFIKAHKVQTVVDATHPFAVEVTKNIQGACKQSKVEYLRLLRESLDYTCNISADRNEEIVYVNSVEAAVAYLKGTQGNIFITTGSKELRRYTEIPDYNKRCYARVLSTNQAMQESCSLGFEGKHLIAMQGPFSVEMNLAMLQATESAYFVTKESGATGGFEEKRRAASLAQCTLVVIGRPKEVGMSMKEMKVFVSRRFTC